MNWGSGFKRLAVVALIGWWAFCLVWFLSARKASQVGLAEFWSQSGYSTDSLRASIHASTSERYALVAAVAVPVIVLVFALAAKWVGKGFKEPAAGSKILVDRNRSESES